jgi:transcriptional repressor NrdR
MRCPSCCGESLRTSDTRHTDGSTVRRGRECRSCGWRWTTKERPEDELADTVTSYLRGLDRRETVS